MGLSLLKNFCFVGGLLVGVVAVASFCAELKPTDISKERRNKNGKDRKD